MFYNYEDIKKILEELLEMSPEGSFILDTKPSEYDEFELMFAPYWIRVKELIAHL